MNKDETFLTLPDMSKATAKECADSLIMELGRHEAVVFCNEMIKELPAKAGYYMEVKALVNKSYE